MMFEGVPLVGLTAPALLSVFVLLIFTGLLIPYRTHKAKEVECERWRTAFETEREARTLSDKQTAELLEGQKNSHAVLVAIFKNSEALLESRRRNDMAS
jgi:hypothetical protein